MSATIRGGLLAAVLALAGCGGSSSGPGKAAATGPLTVDAWKALPPDEKYTQAMLERLKAADPKLETAEGWEAFSKTTLAPERKKDAPKLKK